MQTGVLRDRVGVAAVLRPARHRRRLQEGRRAGRQVPGEAQEAPLLQRVRRQVRVILSLSECRIKNTLLYNRSGAAAVLLRALRLCGGGAGGAGVAAQGRQQPRRCQGAPSPLVAVSTLSKCILLLSNI